MPSTLQASAKVGMWLGDPGWEDLERKTRPFFFIVDKKKKLLSSHNSPGSKLQSILYTVMAASLVLCPISTYNNFHCFIIFPFSNDVALEQKDSCSLKNTSRTSNSKEAMNRSIFKLFAFQTGSLTGKRFFICSLQIGTSCKVLLVLSQSQRLKRPTAIM